MVPEPLLLLPLHTLAAAPPALSRPLSRLLARAPSRAPPSDRVACGHALASSSRRYPGVGLSSSEVALVMLGHTFAVVTTLFADSFKKSNADISLLNRGSFFYLALPRSQRPVER